MFSHILLRFSTYSSYFFVKKGKGEGTGGKGEGQRLKVAEGVMEKDNDSSLEYMNTAVESQPLLQSRTQPVSPGYEDVVITMLGELERAARSQDL